MPLADAENTRIIAFRPSDGGIEHLAIVDRRARSRPSRCWSGSIPNASPAICSAALRCDCGDQLRGAIAEIATRRQRRAALSRAGRPRHRPGQQAARLSSCRTTASTRSTPTSSWASTPTSASICRPPRCCASSGFERVRLLTNNPEKVAALDALRHRRGRARAARLSRQRPQRALSAHQGDAQRPLALIAAEVRPKA